MSRRLIAVSVAMLAASLALTGQFTSTDGRASADYLHVALGDGQGRIEVLRPRGSTGSADQPENAKPRRFAVTGGAGVTGAAALNQYGIQYNGGPVILSARVVAIYWANSTIYTGGPTPGATGTGTADGSLVGFYLRNLGGSPYYNINTTYTDGAGTPIQNNVSYTGFWASNHNAPSGTTNVSDSAIQSEIVYGLN